MVRITLAIISLALAASAGAQEKFSYTYVSAAYSKADINRGGNADGFGIGGSLELAENFHLFGSYAGLSIDQSSADAGAWSAGVGFNTPISNEMDVVVRLFYVSTEFNTPLATRKDDGYAMSAGLRVRANEKMELDAGVSRRKTDRGNDTALDAGFRYSISGSLDVGVTGSWSDGGSILTLDGRLYF